jgi:hypothetical protein
MSKRHKNKTEQGTAGAVASQLEIVSNVTSIRRSPNANIHPSSLPLHMEQIVRRRAYELYEQRGGGDGHAEEDWLHAEAEIVGTTLRRAGVG